MRIYGVIQSITCTSPRQCNQIDNMMLNHRESVLVIVVQGLGFLELIRNSV